MSYRATTSKYIENDVLSRSKEWLVPLLYEHLLANLRRAKVQIEQRDFEGKGTSLEKASSIVVQLIATLDREKAGELGERLAALYAYFGTEVIKVGRTLDTAHLAKLVEMISSLHEAWVAAASGTERRPGNPSL